MSETPVTTSEMVAVNASRDNGEVPRRHRPVQPLRDPQSGETFESSAKERAALAAAAPVWALVRELAADEPFLEAIERGRAGRESSEAIAQRYVRRAGRGRAVMRQVIEGAVASAVSDPRWAVAGMGVVAVWPAAELGAADRSEWSHAKRHRAAATMLVRRGSGRCVVCGTTLASDGEFRYYCGAHQSSVRRRADQELVLGLLTACADSLGIT